MLSKKPTETSYHAGRTSGGTPLNDANMPELLMLIGCQSKRGDVGIHLIIVTLNDNKLDDQTHHVGSLFEFNKGNDNRHVIMIGELSVQWGELLLT